MAQTLVAQSISKGLFLRVDTGTMQLLVLMIAVLAPLQFDRSVVKEMPSRSLILIV